MPIFVASSTVTDPVPTPPIIPDIRATKLGWISNAGRVTEFDDWRSYDSGMVVRPGVLGLGMPSYTFYSDQSPAYDGETIRGVKADPKQITIPIHIWGATRNECMTRFSQLVDDLDPQLGEGTLVVTEPDGSYRTIGAYYTDGFTGQDDDDTWGRTWLSAALVFRCPKPFWEGEEISVTWTLAPVTGDFYPVLPLTVKDSQVTGQVTAVNRGNVRAFPIWELEGPYSSFTASNTTLSQMFFIDKATIAGDDSVVDTREGIKTAYLNGTTNLWEWIDIDSDLWALEPGENSITLTAPAATADSKVTMRYRPRWTTAYWAS